MTARAAVVALLCALLAGGCQRVLFEQPPAAAACDPALVGEWLAEEDDPDETAGESLRLRIDAHCQLDGRYRQSEREQALAPVTLASAQLGEQRYLWLPAAWVHRHFDIDAGPLDRGNEVYVYAWRALDADQLALYPLPVRALARAAVDQQIAADVLQQGDDLVVRVHGDSEASARALRLAETQPAGDPLRFHSQTSAATGEQP